MSVTVERDGPLAVLTHSAPPVNLWDDRTIADFEAALDEIEGDLPRALLVRAEGRVVSGGVDVKIFSQIADGEGGRELWERMIAVPRRFEALPLPTVFAAHALCLTASFEVSLACDILLAAESAKFGLVERVVGLTPAMGGTQRLVERAGPARAREVIYTGGIFGAATLEAWNVVNRVLPEEGFDEAARAFATDLANGPTQAFAAGKAIVREALKGGVSAADALTPSKAGQLFDTRDLKEAVTSFLEQGPGKAEFDGS